MITARLSESGAKRKATACRSEVLGLRCKSHDDNSSTFRIRCQEKGEDLNSEVLELRCESHNDNSSTFRIRCQEKGDRLPLRSPGVKV
ncbi:hypothetical protein PoB_007571000 [Plakobranchus ocellatus]|uniref:Uncharacterized protein n=1 Tax=Plakobranchus ocellatus TaxID=259542 RepID=A0AAV4DYW0_9GAST|nr:hypothetical protein PoB_007571000 [Plakobranchus ocellatus]